MASAEDDIEAQYVVLTDDEKADAVRDAWHDAGVAEPTDDQVQAIASAVRVEGTFITWEDEAEIVGGLGTDAYRQARRLIAAELGRPAPAERQGERPPFPGGKGYWRFGDDVDPRQARLRYRRSARCVEPPRLLVRARAPRCAALVAARRRRGDSGDPSGSSEGPSGPSRPDRVVLAAGRRR